MKKLGFASIAALAMVIVAPLGSTFDVGDASAKDKGPITLVMGTLEDPFFGVVKAGAEQAGKDLGVEVNYIGANLSGPDLARALETAIATNPAGLGYGNWFPETENPIVKRAADAGIPVVAINSSSPDWADYGAMAFVGQSDVEAGILAGKLLAKAGGKHALCANHGAGVLSLEQRCEGFTKSMTEAGGTVTVLRVPFEDATNPTKFVQAVEGALSSDKDIDTVFALGAPFSPLVKRAADEVGRPDIKIGSVDISKQLLDLIRDGQVMFTIDQQAYLQGYYAVSILVHRDRYGLNLVGQVQTGPAVIDKDNVDRVIEVNKAHRGVRGSF
jgi:simple sugar transport system substrate-binding protein